MPASDGTRAYGAIGPNGAIVKSNHPRVPGMLGDEFPVLQSMAFRVRDMLRDPEQTALFVPIVQRLAGMMIDQIKQLLLVQYIE